MGGKGSELFRVRYFHRRRVSDFFASLLPRAAQLSTSFHMSSATRELYCVKQIVRKARANIMRWESSHTIPFWSHYLLLIGAPSPFPSPSTECKEGDEDK